MDRIEYRQLFPWTHLFRAFWIAVDLRKILLGSLGLLLLAGGDALIRMPFDSDGVGRWAEWPWRPRSNIGSRDLLLSATGDPSARGFV